MELMPILIECFEKWFGTEHCYGCIEYRDCVKRKEVIEKIEEVE